MSLKKQKTALELLVERPHITIWHDPENQWLYADWKGDQNYDNVKDGGRLILEQVIRRKAQKILNDNTHVTSAWSDASGEGGKVWFPALASVGVKYFAWIYSPNPFSQLSAELSLSCASHCPDIAVFFDRESAEEWLKDPH